MQMQGFPSTYIFPVSETQAMKQLGNSVCVKAVEMVGKSLLQYLSQLNILEHHIKKGQHK
jgi:DNA (cytosine-5)-methyltransferase 1